MNFLPCSRVPLRSKLNTEATPRGSNFAQAGGLGCDAKHEDSPRARQKAGWPRIAPPFRCCGWCSTRSGKVSMPVMSQAVWPAGKVAQAFAACAAKCAHGRFLAEHHVVKALSAGRSSQGKRPRPSQSNWPLSTTTPPITVPMAREPG